MLFRSVSPRSGCASSFLNACSARMSLILPLITETSIDIISSSGSMALNPSIASVGAPVANASFSADTRVDSCASTIVVNNRESMYLEKQDDVLNQEIQQDEDAVARYGADDPHPLPPKDEPFIPEKRDEEEVTWDGPNDPENPQNWSYGYKWFLTIISSFLTLNV